MLKSKSVEEQKIGLDGLTKSDEFASKWTDDQLLKSFTTFLKKKKESRSNELHTETVTLLKKLIQKTEEKEQVKLINNHLFEMLPVKEEYFELITLFDKKVLIGNVIPLLYTKSDACDFVGSCLKKQKLPIPMDEYHKVLLKLFEEAEKKEYVTKNVRLITDIMKGLVAESGNAFVRNNGVDSLLCLQEKYQKRLNDLKSKWYNTFKSNDSIDRLNTCVNCIKELLKSLVVEVCLTRQDVDSLMELWEKNKGNSEYNEFFKRNYKWLLNAEDGQMAFVSKNGIALAKDMLMEGDISEVVWEQCGIEKIVFMEASEASKLLVKLKLWEVFKRSVPSANIEPHKKFVFLCKLAFIRKSEDALELLEPLYKLGNDSSDPWKKIVRFVADEEKDASKGSDQLKGEAILKVLKNLQSYMQKTVSEEAVVSAVLRLFKNFSYAQITMLSLEILENVDLNSKTFNEFNNAAKLLIGSASKQPEGKEEKIIQILYRHIVRIPADGIKVNTDMLMTIANKNFGENSAEMASKIIQILTRAEIDKSGNTENKRKWVAKAVEKNIGSFDASTVLNALKLLFKYSSEKKYAPRNQESKNIISLMKNVIGSAKKNDVVELMCFALVNNLACVDATLSIPQEIVDAVVKKAQFYTNNVIGTTLATLSDRGLLGPAMLDNELSCLTEVISASTVSIIIKILTGAKSGQAFKFPGMLTKMVFNLSNFVAKVNENEEILGLVYHLARVEESVNDVIREVGGISLLIDQKMKICKFTVLILRHVVEHSQENVRAFCKCGGVDWTFYNLRNTSDVGTQEEYGRILLRICEYREVCEEVANNIDTVYKLAVSDKNKAVSSMFGRVLACVYYTLLGSPNFVALGSTAHKINELIKVPSTERLYAALYLSYASKRKFEKKIINHANAHILFTLFVLLC